MGGHAYWYFAPYQEDMQQALDELCAREFEAGRYNPIMRFFTFSEPEFSAQRPGRNHETIEEAMEAAIEEGTRSILDIQSVGPEPDFGVAVPLPLERLRAMYETDKPTRAMMAERLDFLEDIARGQCAYFVIYAQGRPSELCSAGYSYD